jgi:hypothetical protein
MEDNIIILEDEHGNQVEFAVIDVYELEGSTYFALLEVLPEGEETDEVLLMKVEGEGDDAELIMIEEEEELQAAFNEFLKRDEEMASQE